jgi:16S rRNA A1518/A1519 N6-dimethyltransferase RsmA/KsgA/DIM1 with predicted DNA glycosylase/AP lyase activity
MPKQLEQQQRVRAEAVLALAKKAFAQKRKKLSNSIDRVRLEEAGIDPSLRPQHVSVALWQNLAK